MSRRILPGAPAPPPSPAACLGHSAGGNSILGMPTRGGAPPADPPKPEDPGPLLMRSTATRGRNMVRRPFRPLAAILAVTAMSIPVALLSGRAAIAAPTAALTSKRVAQPAADVAITITSMTPRQAAPGSTITVTGTLKNVSQRQIGHLAVQVLSSSTPLTLAQIQASASAPYGLAGKPVPGASSLIKGQLTRGAVMDWTIHVNSSAIGMTRFGVYPLAAQVRSTSTLTDVPVATSTTYLPYVPAQKGPYGSTIPARTEISWVWPLIDKPLLSLGGQSVCQDPQAKALAASLASGGRLGQLVTAGSSGAHTAITWAVDPALLANAKALFGCGNSEPKMAATARSWLASLQGLSSGQQLFFTPYGDPNVAALIGAGHADDVHRSFEYGQAIGSKILTEPTSAASIAWPAGGIPGNSAGDSVLQYLAADDGIQTLLLGSSDPPTDQPTVLRTYNHFTRGGGYMKIVLANTSLTRLLGSGSTGNSEFATAQEFLAATALLTEQGEPIVVSPPHRWAPAQQLAADLLAVTGSASWLSPVSLASLTGARSLPILPGLPAGPAHGKLNRSEVRVLNRVDSKIAQLQVLKATPDSASSGRPPGCTDPVCAYLAVAAAESSAWHGKSEHKALRALRVLDQRSRQQLRQGVQIEAEQRFTLGGLKGSVPISIDNTLSYKVAVRLHIVPDSSSGMAITLSPGGVVSPKGLITIPAHSVVAVHLRVQATQVGATAVTLSLEDSRRSALLNSPTLRMTIQATQVGVLGVIIFAVALGVFLIATAARAARRGRPAEATEQAADPGLAGEQADERPATQPGPDTVMAERTELGAAGTPGRD
jgi:hypothetical protein